MPAQSEYIWIKQLGTRQSQRIQAGQSNHKESKNQTTSILVLLPLLLSTILTIISKYHTYRMFVYTLRNTSGCIRNTFIAVVIFEPWNLEPPFAGRDLVWLGPVLQIATFRKVCPTWLQGLHVSTPVLPCPSQIPRSSQIFPGQQGASFNARLFEQSGLWSNNGFCSCKDSHRPFWDGCWDTYTWSRCLGCIHWNWRALKWMVHLPNSDQNLPESWPFSLGLTDTWSSKYPANELQSARIIQVVNWIIYKHW